MYTEDIAQGNTLQSIAVSFDRTIQSGREGINIMVSISVVRSCRNWITF